MTTPHTETMNDSYGVFTAPDTVKIERLMPGPIERLWAYLTEAEKRATWLAGGEMELRAGGPIEFVFNNSKLSGEAPPPEFAKYAGEKRKPGVVIECDPPRYLAYTWGDRPDEMETTFELTPRGNKVLLVVITKRLETRPGKLGVSAGWHTHLEILAHRLEGTTPPSFWPRHTQLRSEYESHVPR